MNNVVSAMTQWRRSKISHFVRLAVVKTFIPSAWNVGFDTRYRITRPSAALFAAPNGEKTLKTS